MQINILKIPWAICQFFIGVFINVIIYYVFSPDQGNMLGILIETTTELSGQTAIAQGSSPYNIIWILIFIFCIIVNLALPLWTVFSDDDETESMELT